MPKEHDHDCCRLATSQEAGPLCSGHLLKGPLLPTTPRTTGFPPGCEAVAPQSQNVSSEIGQGGKLAITHLPSFQICDLVYLSAFLLTSAMMLTPLSSNNPSSLHAPCAAVPSPPALIKGRAGSTATQGRLTRHSTKVTQDGACVIGEDGEVPSVSAEESTGASLTDVEGHCPVPRTRAGASDVTLKTVLIFPPGSRCRGCWCPPCRSARPHGSPSPPRASSTLAAGRGRAVSTISLPVAAGPSSTQRCETKGPSSPRATATREQGDGAADRRPHAHGHGGHVHSGRLDKHKV